ncbi:hypothetical protein DERP_003892 [Dermatophagoides pteronyssinus]|uniref:Uncharacterized protein n=1 Tax=Dermatophagoides pteronyssinus TaxID=6956 RepID=A0ABQ8J7J0_DERPT|nr:hypothetical protein DERP_003892 [Dermatophagoides pteronyssinus]
MNNPAPFHSIIKYIDFDQRFVVAVVDGENQEKPKNRNFILSSSSSNITTTTILEPLTTTTTTTTTTNIIPLNTKQQSSSSSSSILLNNLYQTNIDSDNHLSSTTKSTSTSCHYSTINDNKNQYQKNFCPGDDDDPKSLSLNNPHIFNLEKNILIISMNCQHRIVIC